MADPNSGSPFELVAGQILQQRFLRGCRQRFM